MLEDLLIERKNDILKRWSDLIIETYPPDARKFFSGQTDRFANPVGANINEGIEGLYEGLVKGISRESGWFGEFLDQVVRIRAVQEFSPANAVGFIFFLKTAVREILAGPIREQGLWDELLDFESRVDGLALLSFNVYAQCRDTLAEVRINEIRGTVSRILDRACRKYGMPSQWLDPDDDNAKNLT
jgi:hypothetical protein